MITSRRSIKVVHAVHQMVATLPQQQTALVAALAFNAAIPELVLDAVQLSHQY
jgi:hypothetical protein